MSVSVKEGIVTPAAPQPGGAYSQGIAVGGLIFTAGFGPQDPADGSVPDGIEAQTRNVLRNVAATLAERNATLDDVVKATVHLQHLDRDFGDFNRVYSEFFEAPYPARTTVGSTLAGILVEIDVVAALPTA